MFGDRTTAMGTKIALWTTLAAIVGFALYQFMIVGKLVELLYDIVRMIFQIAFNVELPNYF
jgi:hypothetical protein